MLTRPVFELCAYLINFGATLCGCGLVGYGLGRAVIVLDGLADGYLLVGCLLYTSDAADD